MILNFLEGLIFAPRSTVATRLIALWPIFCNVGFEGLNDTKLRSTINAATNKSESFNGFVQWIAFGDAGILRTNNREELRKRIKYNHLVANCLILYNVFEMSRILNELAQEGYRIEPEAIEGLNPYLTKHANRLGQYSLDINREPQPIQYDLPILTSDALEHNEAKSPQNDLP